MKIAHIVCRYPPYYGGMGNVVFQTANELARRGHTVEVFTPDNYDAAEVRPAQAPPQEIHTPELTKQIDYARRLTPSIRYGNAARLPTIADELDDFDIVHLHYPFFGTANLVRKWKLRHPHKPLVITYHMDTRAVSWKGLLFKYYAKFWLPKILQVADAIVTSSLDYIAVSDARHVYNANPTKWLELPFGVDTNRFAPRPKSNGLLQQHQLNTDLPTILFVGGMDQAHYFKGIPILLAALKIVQSNNVSVQTLLVGDGALRPQFEAQAKALGISDRVRFVGSVSDEILPSYYNLADLCVLPSTSRAEAFGMVLLEAMASGVPVVASDLPGVRMVAAQGGMTTQPNNPHDLAEALMGYFAAGNDRTLWSSRVRTLAETRYSWGPIVGGLETLYQGLVDGA